MLRTARPAARETIHETIRMRIARTMSQALSVGSIWSRSMDGAASRMRFSLSLSRHGLGDAPRAEQPGVAQLTHGHNCRRAHRDGEQDAEEAGQRAAGSDGKGD